MSQQIGGYPPASAAGTPTGSTGQPAGSAGQSTGEVARDEAAEVGRSAADAGRQVAGTAAEQAAQVAQEAKAQARDLVAEARGQVQGQARAGQQKATDGIRALSQELREMADGGQQSGIGSEIARQAADRADRLADWLGQREPGDLIEEVRSLARRRPGAFLLGAAVAGAVVGRLTRGAVDAARTDSEPTPWLAYDTGPSGRAAGGYDTATPAQPYPSAQYPSAQPYPSAPSYPGAPSPATGDLTGDPLFAPTTGTSSPGAVGEYGDEVERPRTAPGEAATADRLDDPLRPTPGDTR